ncbi:MBL fold metallo-hydrolase [Poseidonocella sp. HB161398]|uniref:MBL fold metallo-hydrolase n=1 Tax=Poseidonocella sp. HB161398 TaxID=2320855 RepID=UPI001F0EAA26|nr:MBL fold metallo-hydrolase [Poseidonocella sp. HB161398]
MSAPDTIPAPMRHPFPEPPAEGAAVEVAEGILWMRLPLPIVLDHVNCYALDEGDSWTLVDTGMDTARGRAVWQRLLEGPLGGKPVRRVVVTHHHPDHVGLAGWFQAEHGAEILMTRTAWLLARMLRLDEQDVPPAETLDFWRRAGMDAALIEARRSERPLNYCDAVAWMPLGFRQIGEGDRLRLGGRSWRVRLGGGHAPDQATLWCEDVPLVVAGDQILGTISPNIGVYATEPEANPLADWIESCTRLLSHAAPEQLVLPGHKLPFTGLPARLRAMIASHEAALARLRAHLARPRSAAECFPALYRRDISAGEYGLALVEAIAHVNYLNAAGEISGAVRDDGAIAWQMRDRRND